MMASEPDGLKLSTRSLPEGSDAEDAGNWIQLATALMKNRSFLEAMDVLFVALQCDPSHPLAWLLLCDIYTRLDRIGDAQAALDLAERNKAPDKYVRQRRAKIEAAQPGGQPDTKEVSLAEADRTGRLVLSDGGEVAEER